MARVLVCEPRHLYNIINQYRWRSRLTEPNYLCLLDARSQREFDVSHIITAQRIEQNLAGEYLIPNPEELGYVRYCVVYDTGSLGCSDNQEEKETDTGEGDALHHARNLQRFTRHPVLLLKGGYQRFSACYHFLKSQKTLWMPQELDTFQPYPVEILPEKLYMGNFKQASDKQIQRDLKIKALVNVCEQPVTLFAEEGKSLHISVPDSLEADLFSSFPTISHFIDTQLDVGAVLVFSSLGISRCSTVTMAYLMHSCHFSLQYPPHNGIDDMIWDCIFFRSLRGWLRLITSHSLTESQNVLLVAVQRSKAEPCHSSPLASTESLEIPSEMPNEHKTSPRLYGTALSLGDPNLWGPSHRHLWTKLLTENIPQRKPLPFSGEKVT